MYVWLNGRMYVYQSTEHLELFLHVSYAYAFSLLLDSSQSTEHSLTGGEPKTRTGCAVSICTFYKGVQNYFTAGYMEAYCAVVKCLHITIWVSFPTQTL
jgi:hypothetical protein